MFKSDSTLIDKIKQIEKILREKVISWKILSSNNRHLLLEINNRWIFKFFKSPQHLTRKTLEEGVTKKIGHISFCQVPNIEYSGTDFFGYHKIKGHGFNDQMWRSMNRSTQSAFASQLADFLKALHTFSEPVHGMAENWPPNQDLLYEEISTKLYPRLSKKAQLNIIRCLNEAFADKGILAGQKTLVHGDFNEANIIVHNDKLSRIVDFGAAKIMTPAFDFAKMHIVFRNTKIADEILEKYNHPIDKWLKKRMLFLMLLYELEKGCSVYKRHRFLYRLEKKYGDIHKAQLHKILTLKSYFRKQYNFLKHEGFKKCLVNSYKYRKQQFLNSIRNS